MNKIFSKCNETCIYNAHTATLPANKRDKEDRVSSNNNNFHKRHHVARTRKSSTMNPNEATLQLVFFAYTDISICFTAPSSPVEQSAWVFQTHAFVSTLTSGIWDCTIRRRGASRLSSPDIVPSRLRAINICSPIGR